jgi:carboxyl-terminal processing protease
MRSGVKWALVAVAGLVAAVLLVFGGFLLALHPSVADTLRGVLPESFYGQAGSGSEYELQQEVLEKLESTYYKDVDADALEGDAIDGMLAGLGDPYTVYMDPEEYAEVLEKSSGSYSGVGMVVEMKDSLVTIVSTFKDSPAQLAGIRPGDIILSVDGVSTDGLNLDKVVTRIKGPEGTAVTLEMYRPSSSTTTTVAEESEDGTSSDAEASTVDVTRLPAGGTTTEYTLTRKTITIPVTEKETLEVAGKEVAYIVLSTFFSEGAAEELRAQVEQAVEKDHVSAIILDLRSNTGGFLGQAVDVASIFISSGKEIVSVEGLHYPQEVYYANGDAYTQVPLYVLTDEYTASASEIVSGALQDYGRAILVGETTFGKGLVQIVAPLSNGGALKLTSAVYLTPDGRDINATGIAPDVEAPDDPETTEVDEGVEAALDLISGATARQ